MPFAAGWVTASRTVQKSTRMLPRSAGLKKTCFRGRVATGETGSPFLMVRAFRFVPALLVRVLNNGFPFRGRR